MEYICFHLSKKIGDFSENAAKMGILNQILEHSIFIKSFKRQESLLIQNVILYTKTTLKKTTLKYKFVAMTV